MTEEERIRYYCDISETVYEHESGNSHATVTAAEQKSINLIRRLKKERPEEVEIIAESDGCILAHIPYAWIRISPSRIISDEEREQMRERFVARIHPGKSEKENEQ